jgi:putative ABC transport system substrate-binding protein
MAIRLALALATTLAVLATPYTTTGQQKGKTPRIGYVAREATACPGTLLGEAFIQGLGDVGYVPGRSIVVDQRCWEKPDDIPTLIKEIIEQKADVIVASVNVVAFPAKQLTSTIPIVVIASHAPVETGLVASLARPGGNVTGTSSLASDLNAKRIELLREIVPKATRIGFLYSQVERAWPYHLRSTETAARSINVAIRPQLIREPGELEMAFASMASHRDEGC